MGNETRYVSVKYLRRFNSDLPLHMCWLIDWRGRCFSRDVAIYLYFCVFSRIQNLHYRTLLILVFEYVLSHLLLKNYQFEKPS